MGRPRKPVALHVVSDTFRKTRHGTSPREPREVPGPPAWLDATARAEWRRIARILAGIGVLTPLDRGALAALCVSYSRLIAAERALAHAAAHDKVNGGMVAHAVNGVAYASPLIGIANRATALYLKLSREFGLTPASRASIGMPDPPLPKKGDRAEGYF
ncbi:phage terminase small subunit P27 family [Paraburkholderia sp. CNPSo 3281]|uniref:phage terminase small subunit P27 family n=1 Tax=Paraburkholderia sp. CNPSo 3281 TaxID=2940933 RepID=UPI0020B6E6CD|nr:phage terminase small subunit P27 family [Paraburkholderia sp. CNPSo 3281]MCP3719119.1 phage terminase small subunit P27 family [Paraburkholderia sp. CNPSo 3281]